MPQNEFIKIVCFHPFFILEHERLILGPIHTIWDKKVEFVDRLRHKIFEVASHYLGENPFFQGEN